RARPRLDCTGGRDRTEGPASELRAHRAAEGAREAQADIEVEPLARAGEVLVELPASGIDWPRRAKHPRAEAPCEPLDLQVRIGLIGDDAEAAVGDADEKLAHRRLDHVVGDVEQALSRRRSAKAGIELWRD